MSQSQVLARKWRPKNFSELTGQDHVVKALTNALEQNRLHHAYLFTGTRGVGKTTVARILAKALNCETGITATPCGTCNACTQIDQGHFIDLIELDAASNTQVDHMRDLLENALYAPAGARFKIYIIDEVHMLSKSAFNAMLKTLEEPPAHVKFVLATTDPQKIPVTVLSRCLQFNLKQIPIALISEHLKHILTQENISSDGAALALIAKAAQGSMRDALSILDQAIAFGENEVAENTVRNMLGAVDQFYLHDLLEALVSKNGAKMLAIADEIDARGLSFDTVLHDFSVLLHHIALAQVVPQAIHEDEPAHPHILSFAEMLAAEDIQLFYQIALHGRRDLGLAPDEFSGFTMTLIRMLAFMPDNHTTGPAKQMSRTPGIPDAKNTFSASVQIDQPTVSSDHSGHYKEPPATHKTPASVPDLNWHDLIKQLNLAGMAKMLAQHSEAKLLTPETIELFVPEVHRHLLDKKYQNAIQNALDAYFGQSVALNFSVGSITGMTPVALQQLENEQKQTEAIAAIEKDPIVQDLIDSFDAKIIESSIKPIRN
ncbi:DNA polymerase III subunit gamma/tau [Nitrosomonas sp. Nm51]|uniref:DNA polymerase III subunit gamma/tau n=1 Tax=Nitrosomonas sp. Nm51 TaxID=133720 RepID=UPI000B835985|nr:DNA polymerase III subunit gamma/tau [Nitrosomonas sp. Nm51]